MRGGLAARLLGYRGRESRARQLSCAGTSNGAHAQKLHTNSNGTVAYRSKRERRWSSTRRVSGHVRICQPGRAAGRRCRQDGSRSGNTRPAAVERRHLGLVDDGLQFGAQQVGRRVRRKRRLGQSLEATPAQCGSAELAADPFDQRQRQQAPDLMRALISSELWAMRRRMISSSGRRTASNPVRIWPVRIWPVRIGCPLCERGTRPQPVQQIGHRLHADAHLRPPTSSIC